MNFLGHLYFSNNDHDLMYANLFGDFVKGTKLENYSATIQKGIRLHRQIDQYIDNHPSVVELRNQLAKELPKVSGIAIDLYFDHILAKQWDEFHIVPYPQFLRELYRHELHPSDNFSSDFLAFKQQLIANDWMSHYPTSFGLEKLCKGVSSRLSFANSLEQAHEVFDANEKTITLAFSEFINDAIPHFHAFHRII